MTQQPRDTPGLQPPKQAEFGDRVSNPRRNQLEAPPEGLLGGSWAVRSVMSTPDRVITIVNLLITPVISIHEPPSRV